jgi:hypothetical protein
VPLAPHDVAHDVTCELGPLANTASGPCIVAEAAFDLVFLDDGCVHPGVRVDAGCPRPPLAIMNTLGCPRYFEVAAAAEASGTRYQDAFGSCTVDSDGAGGGSAFALGAAFDPGALTRTAETGTTRAALIYVTYGAARMRDTPHLYDRDLGGECELQFVADGQTSQCRPIAGAAKSSLFADAGCTQPIADLAEGGDDSCVVASGPALVQTSDGFHQVGARHADQVYLQIGTSCFPAYEALYDIGARVAVTPMTATKVRDQ